MFISGCLKPSLHNLSRQAYNGIKQHKNKYTRSWLSLSQSRSFATNTEIERKKLNELGDKEYNESIEPYLDIPIKLKFSIYWWSGFYYCKEENTGEIHRKAE